MKYWKLLIGLVFSTCLAWADQQSPAMEAQQPQMGIQPIGPFGMLNTQDDPTILGGNESQDLLNVDVTPGGKSVKKRKGTALDFAFTTSTSAIHGAYKFFDSSGNEIRLWGQDTGLWASVAGASYVQVATGTLNATWQCTDYLGNAYCVTSSRDTPVKTNGTAAGTSYLSTFPLGTIIASTPDRILIAGTAANPERVTYSASGVPTDFTIGTQNSSSSFEPIIAPGSGITHLAYRYGKWLWWKDASFGFIVMTNQFDLVPVTISNYIGTYDNTDVYDQGITYFRGSDNQFWAFDGANLVRISREITPTVNSANRRKSNQWVQTSQTDFAAGTIQPSTELSTSQSAGDVIVSSFGVTENTSTSQWSAGTASNMTVGTSSLTLTLNNSGNVTNNDFETGSFANWTTVGSPIQAASAAESGCTVNPQTGSKMVQFNNGGGGTKISGIKASIIKNSDSSVLYTNTFTCPTSCSGWTLGTLPASGIAGYRSKFKFEVTAPIARSLITTESYILGGDVSFYYRCDNTDAINNDAFIDNVQNGSSTITSGSFTSQTFDTKLSSPIAQLSAFTYTAATPTPVFSLFSSSTSAGPWTNLTSAVTTNKWGQRYYFYSSTISVTSADDARSAISAVSMVARSTGTYYSAVNNAANQTAWNTFNVTDTAPGSSAISYFTRATNTIFTVTSSTPAWVAQTKNALVTASTGTYMQMKAVFTITAATETPTINDFTFNWYEGNASDKMYGTYFDYALWFSVSLGTTTTNNNRILKYDLLNRGWTLYDIASNGFLIYNNALYTGDASVGKTYLYTDNVTSDNNVAINSYWKSKDFFGATPFLDNDLRTMSWYAKTSSGTTLTVTYQTNRTTSTSYTINLFDSKSSIIKHNRNFPAGTVAGVFNVKFGDNSSNSPWEVYAGQYTFNPKPWNVYP